MRNLNVRDKLVSAMHAPTDVREAVQACEEDAQHLLDRLNEKETWSSRVAHTDLVTGQNVDTKRSQPVIAVLPPGTALGNYIIEEPLGRGGMGVVYRARHRRMDRVVALKILPEGFARDPAAVSRFQREIKAIAQLTHPNIVSAYDSDEANGVLFLAMEHISGSDLQSFAKSFGKLAIGDAVEFVIQAARGLAYAHEKGVIHRDVKPANLLLDQSGVVKVLDLGLARLTDSASISESTSTLADTVMGTVDFIAPEQAHESKQADERSDIYSLGCTLFYLLAGRAVFDGDTAMKKLVAHHQALGVWIRRGLEW